MFRGENLRAAGHVLIQEMEAFVARLRRDCADGGFVNVLQLFPQLTLDMFVDICPHLAVRILMGFLNQLRSRTLGCKLQSDRGWAGVSVLEGKLSQNRTASRFY